MKDFIEVIQKVSRGEKLSKDLTREEARDALRLIFEKKASEFQIGAFFSALRMKGESGEETAGFVDAVRERAEKLKSTFKETLDLGEPYDGKIKTLHLTLPVALVLAAAGVPVVLHGTRETPVKKGVEIQGLLQAVGIEPVEKISRLEEILKREKIVFLPTEKLAPDFARLRPYREAFGLRPFANHIEKIFNLAHASTQMVGIYHKPYLEPMAGALSLLGTERIFVIQGVEGFSELYISRKTLVLKVEAGETQTLWLDPAEYGLKGEEALAEKNLPQHVQRLLQLLGGSEDKARPSVLWNAGVKLFWMKKSPSIKKGLELAREILDSGKALDKLEGFKNAAQEKNYLQTI